MSTLGEQVLETIRHKCVATVRRGNALGRAREMLIA
jgi:hypothetical protein